MSTTETSNLRAWLQAERDVIALGGRQSDWHYACPQALLLDEGTMFELTEPYELERVLEALAGRGGDSPARELGFVDEYTPERRERLRASYVEARDAGLV